MRILYVHWNQTEAAAPARLLRKAGHVVHVHWSSEKHPVLCPVPDAFIISIARLPSHGRAIAEWVREAKSRQSIPLIFVGGTPDKIAETRKRFPDARYCGPDEVPGVLRNPQL